METINVNGVIVVVIMLAIKVLGYKDFVEGFCSIEGKIDLVQIRINVRPYNFGMAEKVHLDNKTDVGNNVFEVHINVGVGNNAAVNVKI